MREFYKDSVCCKMLVTLDQQVKDEEDKVLGFESPF